MKKKKLLILGLGNLGKKVFRAMEESYVVNATYRDIKKVEGFDISNLIKYEATESIPTNLPSDYDIILCTFTPIPNLLECLGQWESYFNPKALFVFISSTSVFGAGFTDESQKRLGDSRNASLLIAAEDQVKLAWENFLILRPGGLVDERRNPDTFFKRTKIVRKSKDFVNLVHVDDVVRFLDYCLTKNIKNTDFNLVFDINITKEDFYSNRAHSADLEFDDKESSLRKISNNKSLTTGFQYKFPIC